ncbi:MAG: outer membrane lipoprotein-sorting protein, partial [Candidatus Marinimicrobia bacterium]|nr:outer membrane lipoprotein-sorting protein [Candidatus Neomarinimicrobiota bacterium]
MKKLIIILFFATQIFGQYPDAADVLRGIDQNMASENQVVVSTMVIHGRRTSRSITAKSWTEGSEKSFTEYLAPAREKGSKMLKIDDQLWMYSPQSDRVIRISGHMLRQSVMGSDLSYEDMMEDRKLEEIYSAKIIDEELIDKHDCWI